MNYIEQVKNKIKNTYPNEKEFIQATSEVLDSLSLVINSDSRYQEHSLLEKLIEPERIISFDVHWIDDQGKEQINKGYRVQFNSVLGPYKGGLRFHPSVNLSVLKFLGFEQIFKNALTGLELGGGKGGSNFDPKGKSDAEIKRFCEAFMDKLYKYIGPTIDVPAGDIGVGAKEITYLLEEYKRKTNSNEVGVLTGKTIKDGGSLGRKEATGYGLLYFVEEMLKYNKLSLKDKKILVSGSGNVAIYAIEKAIELGAKVISASDSNGYIIDEDGIDLNILKQIKEEQKLRIKEYINYKDSARYFEGNVFNAMIDFDIALPCATQNEITLKEAQNIHKHHCMLVAEGANMPTNNEAIEYFKENNILHAPGKASNAGGVSVSGLEMIQNKLHETWSKEKVDNKLKEIMHNIHSSCINACLKYNIDPRNYIFGANVAGFLRVSEEMLKH